MTSEATLNPSPCVPAKPSLLRLEVAPISRALRLSWAPKLVISKVPFDFKNLMNPIISPERGWCAVASHSSFWFLMIILISSRKTLRLSTIPSILYRSVEIHPRSIYIDPSLPVLEELPKGITRSPRRDIISSQAESLFCSPQSIPIFIFIINDLFEIRLFEVHLGDWDDSDLSKKLKQMWYTQKVEVEDLLSRL